jgi:hypothetical protein
VSALGCKRPAAAGTPATGRALTAVNDQEAWLLRNAGESESSFVPRKHTLSRSEGRLSGEFSYGSFGDGEPGYGEFGYEYPAPVAEVAAARASWNTEHVKVAVARRVVFDQVHLPNKDRTELVGAADEIETVLESNDFDWESVDQVFEAFDEFFTQSENENCAEGSK